MSIKQSLTAAFWSVEGGPDSGRLNGGQDQEEGEG